MPNDATRPWFDEADMLGIGFCLGYAIFGPPGELLASTETNADELIVADCDLDWCG